MSGRTQRAFFEDAGDYRWAAADYEIVTGVEAQLFDPWAPPRARDGQQSLELETPEIKGPETRPETIADFWLESFTPADEPNRLGDWDDLDLPRFDPNLGSARDLEIDFDEPLRRGAHFKALMVTKLSSIATPWGRARLASLLEDIFDEYPSAGTYKRWIDFASEIDDLSTVELAFEIKKMWDQTPSFWYYRLGPNAAPQFHESARTQMSWRSAFDMAASDPSKIVDDLLTDDLLENWRDLQGPCPGFWSFGTYVELMATGDEYETAAVAALSRIGQRRASSTHRLESSVPKVARVHTGTVHGEAAKSLEDAYLKWISKRESEASGVPTTLAPKTKRKGKKSAR